MKREEIENKDQELIKKFRTIIQNKEEKKPAPKKAFPFWLFFLFTALILSSMLLLKQLPALRVSKMPQTSFQAQFSPDSVEQPISTAGTVEIKVPSDAPKALAPLQKMATQEIVPKSSDPILGNPVLEQRPLVESSHQKVQGKTPSGIRIEEIISCSSVNNKQYSRPQLKFSLSQETTPTIWMKVISENPPFTLTHVYYVNGRKYCEVPLAIRFHRMRTWSSITLRSPGHIGKWRVEVIADGGTKLDQIQFIVVK